MGKGGESEACGYAFHANHHQRGEREKGRRRHLLVTLLLVEKKIGLGERDIEKRELKTQ